MQRTMVQGFYIFKNAAANSAVSSLIGHFRAKGVSYNAIHDVSDNVKNEEVMKQAIILSLQRVFLNDKMSPFNKIWPGARDDIKDKDLYLDMDVQKIIKSCPLSYDNVKTIGNSVLENRAIVAKAGILSIVSTTICIDYSFRLVKHVNGTYAGIFNVACMKTKRISLS